MIEKAERLGNLKKGQTIIIEPTSGNTGIALSGIAKTKGYKVEVVVSTNVSKETKNILKSFGANIWEADDDLCPRVGKGTDQAISLAKGIVQSYKGKYFMPNQYENTGNIQAHYCTTGPEIWKQTAGKITHFIAGIGTGGTIVGVGKYLKEKKHRIKIIAVEPEPRHHIQGLRNLKESDIPKILEDNLDIIDDWITVTDEDAFQQASSLQNRVAVGPSSGATFFGSLKIASEINKGHIVTIFADKRDRYETVFDLWNKGFN